MEHINDRCKLVENENSEKCSKGAWTEKFSFQEFCKKYWYTVVELELFECLSNMNLISNIERIA